MHHTSYLVEKLPTEQRHHLVVMHDTKNFKIQ